MHNWQNWNRVVKLGCRRQTAVAIRPRWEICCACLVLISALNGAAQASQASIPPGGALRMDRVDLPTPINQPPDPNTQMKMREQQSKQRNYTGANAERKKQIAEVSERLLKLAVDLKTEVDKASNDTLSLNVIRKADEIENLAHSVKEKMKLTVGAN
jgi:hypothetical protein